MYGIVHLMNDFVHLHDKMNVKFSAFNCEK